MQAARIAIALDLAIGIDRAQLLGVHRVELELTTHAIAQLLNYVSSTIFSVMVSEKATVKATGTTMPTTIAARIKRGYRRVKRS